MSKSIFAKYFRTTSAIVLACFTFFGAVLLVFAKNYWQKEQLNLFAKNANNLGASFSESVDITKLDSLKTMSSVVSVISNSVDADVFVCNKYGKIIYGKINSSGVIPSTVPTEIMKEALYNPYSEVGKLGGVYASETFVASSPILNSKLPVGAVFVCGSASSLTRYTMDVFKMLLLVALLALMVCFVVIYLMTYRMVQPLRHMAAASRRMVEGDFSYRVPVVGDDEIAELSRTFNGMALSLSSLENMRRSFVANVSHELKTPMTTIAGFIDGILDGTIPPEKQDHYLKLVSNEVKRLSRLVRSMLDISKIQSGEVILNKCDFDIYGVVLESFLAFEQKIEGKGINVEGLDVLPHKVINADPDKIHQVVYNLIDNAVKFTNDGGYIRVNLEEKDDKVYLYIRNSGMGIPANELPNVFERFYKTDKSRGIDKQGVGLGLYIVKNLINIHDGEISVRSVEGEYCEFYFWLPDKVKPQETEPDKQEKEKQSKEKKQRTRNKSSRSKKKNNSDNQEKNVDDDADISVKGKND